MRRHNLAVGLIGSAVLLAACGSGGELPKLPGGAAAGASRRESAAASADMSMRVANLRYELGDGVSTDVKTAKAYEFADTTNAAVTKLAKTLGVAGTIKQENDAWSVGGNDKGAGSYLYVARNGGVFSMSVSYAGSGSVSSGCSVEPTSAGEPDAPVVSDIAACDTPPSTTTIPANAPSAAEAKKVATDTLEAAGVDLSDAKVTTETYDGASQNVRFQHSVDGGTVEGYESFVTVGPDNEVLSASGYLVQPSSVGSYDLATLKRAVERLNDSFGNMTTRGAVDDMVVNGLAPEPAPDSASEGAPDSAPDPAISEAPADSSEPTVITLTSVTVGRMMQSDFDGDLWLVPAYRFGAADDNVVSAQAADDKYIEQPPTTTTPKLDGGTTEPGAPEPGAPGECAAVNGGLTAEVCVTSTTVKAGETVIFRITAYDEDRAFSSGPCFDGVSAVYGDDAGGEVRCEACSTEVAEGPGKVGLERRHAYAKAGTYVASFTIKSGADCAADPKDSQGKVSLTIKVA